MREQYEFKEEETAVLDFACHIGQYYDLSVIAILAPQLISSTIMSPRTM
jgi:hypothetical protein